MYFAIGWPKVLNIPHLNNCSIRKVVCNRDKVFFAILSDDTLSIFFCKPCLPIVLHRRSQESVEDIGMNESVQWKPDSSMLIVATSGGFLVYYHLTVDSTQKGLYQQVDSPQPNLRRDSAELFVKEVVPPLQLTVAQEVAVGGGILSMVCIRDELMVSTTRGHVLRYRWDCTQNRDYCLDLRRIPFCIDQQVSKAVPIVQQNTYITDIEYSPLIGGFAVVFNDGRAAFLTAASLKFDPNQVQGIWAPNMDDATCATVNHKYRLITYGRKSRHATYRRVALPRILLQWEWQLLLIGQTLSSGRGPAPFTKSLTEAPVKASSQLLVRSVRYTHMMLSQSKKHNSSPARLSYRLPSDKKVQSPRDNSGLRETRGISQGAVYCIDESSGGLELSHQLTLSSQVYPGEVGPVGCVRWTPDGCALAMAWSQGGFSVWSTFGALLVCSLGWDYGLHVDLAKHNPLLVTDMVSTSVCSR
ncbi:WD40 repeat protein [Homalodisca vitripennis]|nr:WD40 repeat protein [Homalodisca vitripennis]